MCGGYDPLRVNTHVKCPDGVTETWKKSLGVLTYLLVKPDLAVEGANGEPSLDSRGDLVELRIGLISLLLN